MADTIDSAESGDWYDITDAQIRTLQREGRDAGDARMVDICGRACGDDETATQSEIKQAREWCANWLAITACDEEG